MRALECILAEQKRRVGASRCQNRGKIYGPRWEAALGHEGQKKLGKDMMTRTKERKKIHARRNE